LFEFALWRGMGRRGPSVVDGFGAFVSAYEARLRQAFTAMWGPRIGREVTVDVLSFAWECWERIESMENPVGYLFVVGRDRGRRGLHRHDRTVALVSDTVDRNSDTVVDFEPALASLVEGLPTRERQVVLLVYGYQWSMGEVGELLGVSKSTVQTHAERAMTKLRAGLGVRS
jgi:RNA polymerase sigma factor (sigma-70 family)